jgi:RNA polymerase sigma-70 factor (ECF subfamily)
MNQEEISSLYLRLGPLIYRRCLRLLGDVESARDATQEVFVRTLRHADELRDDRGCLPWLYRVATNYCLNHLRDGGRVELRDPNEVPEAEVAFHAADSSLLARERLLGLLRELDEVEGSIVVYAFMDGMTQDEIARVLGLSRRTVNKKLGRFQRRVERAAGEVEPT